MGLGGILGAAGNAIPAAQAGLEYGRWVVNSQREQEARNRAREAAIRIADRNAGLIAANAADPLPGIGVDEWNKGEIVAAPPPAPTPTPAPAPAPAPTAAAGATPPAAAAATVPQLPPGSSPSAVAITPSYVEAGRQAATAAPTRTPGGITQQQADAVAAYLRHPDAEAFFAQHPEQLQALQANREKWIRDVYIPNKVAGLHGLPHPSVRTAQIREYYPEPEGGRAGALERAQQRAGITPAPAYGRAGALERAQQRQREEQARAAGIPLDQDPRTMRAEAARTDAKIKQIDTVLNRVAGNLTTTTRQTLAEAQTLAAPDLTITPQAATDVVPTATTPMQAGAAVEVAQGKPPSAHYLANPGAVGADTRRALRTREHLVAVAQELARVGTPEAAAAINELIPKLDEIDTGVVHMQGMRAIRELTTLHDPRLMEQVMSYHLDGVPIHIQAVSDGTYNVIRGDTGEVAAEGLSLTELVHRTRSLFDDAYVQANVAAETKASEEARAHYYKMLEGQQTGEYQLGVQAIKSESALKQALATAQMTNDGKIAVAAFEAAHPGTKIYPLADGTMAITSEAGAYTFNPNGRTITDSEGNTTTIMGAEPVNAIGGPGAGTTLGTFLAGEL